MSALLILEKVMEKMMQQGDSERSERVPLPYEYFDIIGGTSTGG